jgi:hypothetical protein
MHLPLERVDGSGVTNPRLARFSRPPYRHQACGALSLVKHRPSRYWLETSKLLCGADQCRVFDLS